MARVSAVLLAAGESRRMGQRNKLRLSVEGLPLLARTVETLLASRLRDIVVVLGHEAEGLRPMLDRLPVTVAYNPRYREGHMTSVYKGMEALSRPCDGVMVCLSDQPLLAPQDIDMLIDAFAGLGRGAVLVPFYRGARGNPVILAHEHCQAILKGDRKGGFKRFIDDNPGLVTAVEMASDHVVFDLDTPQDYEALLARLGEGGGGVLGTRSFAPKSCP